MLRRSEFLNLPRLGQGYAIYINTLQNPSDSCNAFLAGETAMMGKEHIIETYGVPRCTVSLGSSGGAYTTLQIIDAFPGLFDGALTRNTFPDARSIALAAMDAPLLRHYFSSTSPGTFNEAEQVWVSGYQGLRAWYDTANQAARTDPVPARNEPVGYTSAVRDPVVPISLRHNPGRIPMERAPRSGTSRAISMESSARQALRFRVFDNVGVQHGLIQLNAGWILRTTRCRSSVKSRHGCAPCFRTAYAIGRVQAATSMKFHLGALTDRHRRSAWRDRRRCTKH